jgi:hypothetical protein
MPYRPQISLLNSATFEDIEPFVVRAAFEEIRRHLRLGAEPHVENSMNALRRAADYYVDATRTNLHARQ